MNNKKACLDNFEVENLSGLSEIEAAKRLKRDGYNEIPSGQRRGIFRIIFGVLKEPMFLLLVACGSIYLILGDVGEAIMLLGFVFVIMGITVYQEGKTERAIDALRDLSSPRALVIRDHIQRRIPGKEVVKGDYIIIKEGDRVPADSVLVWGMNISADESLLTGESVPVRKSCSAESLQEPNKPGGDDLPYLYSGSLIVQGQGVAEVIAIGSDTEMGKIGKVLDRIEGEETFLQKETGKLVQTVFFIALLLCFLVFMTYGITRGDWLSGVLAGITLAMAMLPEEFPVVLTIFLALGAWRISKKNVLTRKISAVEILGSATVLCVDKTGTLTQNKMAIKKIFNGKRFYDIPTGMGIALPEDFHELVEYGILASKKDPFDPMEKALKELGHDALKNTEHLHTDWPLIEEYPLSKEVMALSHVWDTPDKKGYTVSAKGAPEAIQDLCHFTPKQKEELAGHINMMAGEGLRVIGVAKSYFDKEKLPSIQHDFDFEFVGLIGLADPIRETVPHAIRECYTAGMRTVMITGDYPATAQNIARQIGLKNPDRYITGPELEKMPQDELRRRIAEVNIFARVVPEQKLIIVDAFKANGEVVAMTGDGVNDAPALKSAHIGVAMGERGTDVARESAELVLIDDDFSSIVEAVSMGRRIFDNLKKAMAYIISVHVPIAGTSLLPILMGWPLILYPAHIVFLELVIDPACSVVFESEAAESGTMQRPPRDPKSPLFGWKLLLLSFLQGFFAFIVVMAVFKIALLLHHSENEARALSFATLIISNICLIMVNRSWTTSAMRSLFVANKAFLWVVVGAIMFLCMTIYVPFLRTMFHFGKIGAVDFAICVGAGIWSVVWFELIKFIFKKFNFDLMKA